MGDLLDLLSDDQRSPARERSMPSWTDPMLAKLTHDYFDDENWLFERKLDGERVLAFVDDDGGVRLRSRDRKELNDTYPELAEALGEHAPAGCILDGEVVALNSEGISDFQRLQPRMQAESRRQAGDTVTVYYYLFDCLYADGHDITRCPLRARKRVLKSAIDWADPLRWTPHRNAEGVAYYREACEKGWEGVIAKDARSAYAHSRSSKWLKFKCVMQQEFVIGGFTEPEGERTGLGALLLGFYREGDLVYAGEVGAGFDDETLARLRDRLDARERKTSPYDRGDPDSKGVHFVTPELVCEVAFTEWTDGDKLRHPRYKGLRRDKNPADVHKELASQEVDL